VNRTGDVQTVSMLSLVDSEIYRQSELWIRK
jgi:hypothetical protein